MRDNINDAALYGEEDGGDRLEAFTDSSDGPQPHPEAPYSKEHYRYMKSLLKQRVKHSRYKHSVSVAKTARLMARAYGIDPDMARMAGLLHDWDKSLSTEELRDRVDTYAIDVDPEIVNDMPWLLHGPTAAAVLADKHPEFDHAVYQAISRHTLGAPNMSKLDMIIFVADKIEPTHPVPVYQALYNRIGRLDLFDLYFAVQQENLSYLIDSGRPLNHEAVSVWNHCVKLHS